MTEEYDEQLQAALARAQVVEDRCVAFLMENGEDLFHDEPPPREEEYESVFFSGTLSHLATADERTLVLRAAEAYLDAYAGFRNRITEYEVKYMLARSIALLCAMLFEVRDEISTSMYQAQQDELRDHIIQQLWFYELWRDPWITLLNAELPGREPTSVDIDRYEAAASARLATMAALQEQREELQQEMEVYLLGHGYICESDDRLAILFLIHDLELQQHTHASRGEGEFQPANPYDISELASDSAHPAWQALVQHFYGPSIDNGS